jgi:hypothetical protein
MPNPVFVGASDSGKIYRIGRVGLDTGTEDPDGVFTATLLTEKHSPAGEGGLCLFRRVYVRIHHTGEFIAGLRAYVDGVQTQVYGPHLVGSVVVTGYYDQVATLIEAAPMISPNEVVKEVAISAQGTSIEVQVDVLSDDITGIFLIENISVGSYVIRESKERGGSSE